MFATTVPMNQVLRWLITAVSVADRAPAIVTMDSGGEAISTSQEKRQEQEKVNFIVGCEDGHDDNQQEVEGEIPEEEASDLFPTEGNPPTRENSSSSSLNSMFVLAEKRKRLR
ncbi:hypothetical protein L798_08901 [Zootermopsis nevadensis]|uniref:Uncharacterized protein n=1 Tax=Zootermopsis nevadensis TaxID=136037 RepID=A0A067RCR7_ZOONE|nr:hypothetical protein L798_08901 [Zootermopsis nevadensis]